MLDATAEFTSAAALAAFSPAYGSRRVLVVGAEARSVVSTICHFGGTPVVLDPEAGILAFDDASFDAIILNRAAEGMGMRVPSALGPAALQRRFLSECERVLKPGGWLLLVGENRASTASLGGRRRDPVTGNRYLGVLPYGLAGLYTRIRYRRPYRYRSYSRGGWIQLLRKSGFSVETVRIPVALSSKYSELRPEPGWNAPAGGEPTGGGGALKKKLARTGVRVLRSLGLGKWIVPDFLMLARKPDAAGRAGAGDPVLARIARAEGQEPFLSDAVFGVRKKSETISFLAGG